MSKGYVGRRNYISCFNMIYSRDLRIVLIFSLNQRGKGVFFLASLPLLGHITSKCFVLAKHLNHLYLNLSSLLLYL